MPNSNNSSIISQTTDKQTQSRKKPILNQDGGASPRPHSTPSSRLSQTFPTQITPPDAHTISNTFLIAHDKHLAANSQSRTRRPPADAQPPLFTNQPGSNLTPSSGRSNPRQSTSTSTGGKYYGKIGMKLWWIRVIADGSSAED
eukprot:gene13159-27837_t